MSSPIYEIDGENIGNGFLLRTSPLLIFENDNMTLGKSYKIDFESDGDITVSNSGSSFNTQEIKSGERFMARGKLLIIELAEDKEIDVTKFRMSEI